MAEKFVIPAPAGIQSARAAHTVGSGLCGVSGNVVHLGRTPAHTEAPHA